jgi:hypothetical protein
MQPSSEVWSLHAARTIERLGSVEAHLLEGASRCAELMEEQLGKAKGGAFDAER